VRKAEFLFKQELKATLPTGFLEGLARPEQPKHVILRRQQLKRESIRSVFYPRNSAAPNLP